MVIDDNTSIARKTMPKNKKDIFNLSLNADLVVLSACQAQLQLQQEDEWAAPYFWAAFTLQGEWR